MAKKTADPCIFCDALPCECEGSKPRRAGKRLPSVAPINVTTVELPVDDVKPETLVDSKRARMKARAAEDAARTPAPSPVTASSPQPRSPTRRARTEPQKEFDSERIKSRITAQLDEETVILNEAVRVIGKVFELDPMKHPEFTAVMTSESTLEEQKILWKARNRERQASASS